MRSGKIQILLLVLQTLLFVGIAQQVISSDIYDNKLLLDLLETENSEHADSDTEFELEYLDNVTSRFGFGNISLKCKCASTYFKVDMRSATVNKLYILYQSFKFHC